MKTGYHRSLLLLLIRVSLYNPFYKFPQKTIHLANRSFYLKRFLFTFGKLIQTRFFNENSYKNNIILLCIFDFYCCLGSKTHYFTGAIPHTKFIFIGCRPSYCWVHIVLRGGTTQRKRNCCHGGKSKSRKSCVATTRFNYKHHHH